MAKTIAKESIRSTIIHYFGIFIGLITTFFILPYYFSKEEIGLTRLIVEVATLLAGVAMVGLSTSISRFFPYFYDGDANLRSGHHGFFGFVIRILGIGLLITLPLIYLFRTEITTLFIEKSPLFASYYLWVIPLTLFIALWSVFELLSIQLLHLSTPKTIREVALRLFLLIPYLLYAWGYISFYWCILLFVLTYGGCMMLSLGYLSRISRLSLHPSPSVVTPDFRREFRRYSLLYTLTTVGTILAGRMDLFVLSTTDTHGLDSVAVFSIAFFMVAIIETPTRAINSLITPKIARAMKENRHDIVEALYKQSSFYQLLSATIIFLGIWVNMDNIFGIMPHGTLYSGGKYVFLFLGLGKLVEVSCTSSHPIISNSPYYHWNLYYTAIIVLMAIATNLYFVPLWGPVGAGLATLCTTTISYGFQVTMLRLRTKLQPFSLPMLQIGGMSAILVGVNQLIPQLSSPIFDLGIRSIILGLVGLLFLWKTKMIHNFLSFVQQKGK